MEGWKDGRMRREKKPCSIGTSGELRKTHLSAAKSASAHSCDPLKCVSLQCEAWLDEASSRGSVKGHAASVTTPLTPFLASNMQIMPHKCKSFPIRGDLTEGDHIFEVYLDSLLVFLNHLITSAGTDPPSVDHHQPSPIFTPPPASLAPPPIPHIPVVPCLI
ncbi:unnamed protein product [Pleuronectes platessa]|uniref:Uncharacterized protein n=1 Tax=Pleuronectes platessa TaxID=8262 RepID=A0A9N7TNS4_PLEPL|nr:unnamed protein product [Pleuronectes platessa]